MDEKECFLVESWFLVVIKAMGELSMNLGIWWKKVYEYLIVVAISCCHLVICSIFFPVTNVFLHSLGIDWSMSWEKAFVVKPWKSDPSACESSEVWIVLSCNFRMLTMNVTLWESEFESSENLGKRIIWMINLNAPVLSYGCDAFV